MPILQCLHKNKMPMQRLLYKVARLYERILNTTAYFLKFGMDTMKYLFFFLFVVLFFIGVPILNLNDTILVMCFQKSSSTIFLLKSAKYFHLTNDYWYAQYIVHVVFSTASSLFLLLLLLSQFFVFFFLFVLSIQTTYIKGNSYIDHNCGVIICFNDLTLD
jgi:hypothetical protein